MKYLRTNTYLGYIEGYYGNLLNWRDRNSIIYHLKKIIWMPISMSKEDLNHRFDWRRKYSKFGLTNSHIFVQTLKTT